MKRLHRACATLILGVLFSLSVSLAVAQTQPQLHVPNACDQRPGGPPPCKDSDGDGLCDSWEIAKRLPGGAPLPDADPNQPDVYVQYDWMDYGGLDYACSTDFDCLQNGATCTGPAIPGTGQPRSCIQACQVNADCTALGPAHAADICTGPVGAKSCKHTHDPELLAPGAIAAVQAQFAAHGINLHVVRGHAVPHSHVLSFRLLQDALNPANVMTDACEGGSVASGTAGPGLYAESFYDIKARYFDFRQALAFHYTIFSHYSSCDTDVHCATCPRVKGTTPIFDQSGIAEVNGNDFMVSLGAQISDFELDLVDDAGGLSFGQLMIGGTFMHELGHNLGLRHGGGVSPIDDPAVCPAPDCEESPGYKPNYLSVMNYRYQTGGIQAAAVPGDTTPTTVRLDYSNQTLPMGGPTPGALVEAGQLDEVAGLGSGNSDLFRYTDSTCIGHLFGPTNGPVDWNGDGIAGDTQTATADLNPMEVTPPRDCTFPVETLRGHTDWGPAPGRSIFRYKFQCTPFFADGAGTAPPESLSAPELSARMAKEAHVLYPMRTVQVMIRPGCSAASKPVAPGQVGTLTVALLGDASLDAQKVDVSSLQFHAARPLSIDLRDVNGDGYPDLVMTFDTTAIKLHPEAKVARLTGWLKNSQAFVGEDKVRVVSSTAMEDPSCR